MTPKTTNIVLLSTTVLLLAYEALTLASGTESTISEAFWSAIFETPLVTFALGMLAGHIVWQKSVCVHCGLRPWAKVDDGRFGALLRKYYLARVDGVGHVAAMQYARGTVQALPSARPTTPPEMS